MYTPDPIQVGLKGLGYGISVTAGTTIVNWLLSVFKNYNRELMIVSCVLMSKFPLFSVIAYSALTELSAAFSGALAAVKPHNPKLAVALGTIAGFGVGGVLVPPSTIAVTVCDDSLIATTIALSLSVRLIGGSIGYTIYFNIFSRKLSTALPEYIVKSAIRAGLPPANAESFADAFLKAPATLAKVPGVTPEIIAAATLGSQNAYAYAFSFVWYSSIAFGAIAILAAFFLGNNRKYLTNRIAAKIRS